MKDHLYTDQQLDRIRGQAAIYQCACPAQVCAGIAAMRKLHNYQTRCMDATDIDRAVHQRIAEAAAKAHAELERCLDEVLKLEGWDAATLTMPEKLQKRLLDSISRLDE